MALQAQCGAVTEAVKLYLEPCRYVDIATDHSLRSIVDQIQVAVRVAGLELPLLWIPQGLDRTTADKVVRPHLEQVREVGTAADAVDVSTADRPDLMLLDINLPDRSGWDVMRELRRLGIDVPTIVVSAVRVNQSRLDEFHPMAYLPKPFPLEALRRLVVAVTDDELREFPEPEA